MRSMAPRRLHRTSRRTSKTAEPLGSHTTSELTRRLTTKGTSRGPLFHYLIFSIASMTMLVTVRRSFFALACTLIFSALVSRMSTRSERAFALAGGFHFCAAFFGTLPFFAAFLTAALRGFFGGPDSGGMLSAKVSVSINVPQSNDGLISEPSYCKHSYKSTHAR